MPGPSAGVINGQLNLFVNGDTLRPCLCPKQFVPPLPGLRTAFSFERNASVATYILTVGQTFGYHY